MTREYLLTSSARSCCSTLLVVKGTGESDGLPASLISTCPDEPGGDFVFISYSRMLALVND